MQPLDTNFDIPEGSVSGRHCQQLLRDIAAWTMKEADMAKLFPRATPAQLRQIKSKLNRDEVRIAMLVLSHDALLHGHDSRETFSIRRLARILDQSRSESMQRTLRNWMLPILSEVGWIEGFGIASNDRSPAHVISVSCLGLDAVREYLRRLA